MRNTSDIRKMLFERRDRDYLEFNSKLVPNVPKETMIGVRIPDVRSIAAELGNYEAEAFMRELPHKYHEENNLHAAIICRIRDFDRAVEELDRFLPFVDNWASCDMMYPRVLAKYPERLSEKALGWMRAAEEYTVRYGIGVLMKFFLDKNFSGVYPEAVAGVERSEYYIMMMKAWYFATALAKRYDETIIYLEERRLDVRTHNASVRKALESYRIPEDRKRYIAGLRIK